VPIPFTCPHCGLQTSVDERYAGQSGPCYRCGQMVTVPGGPAAYAPAVRSGPSSGSVVAIVLVVVGLLGLLVCGGFMALFVGVWSAKSQPVARPVPFTAPFDESSEDFGQLPAVDLPAEFYESPAPDRFTRVHLEPADGELPALLRTHAAKAKAAGRKPFVEFGSAGDTPCLRFDFSLGDRRMIDALSGTYLIHVNADRWGAAPARASFHVSNVPAFFEIDERGRPTGRSIEIGTDITDSDGDLCRRMARVLKPFFQGGSR